MDHPIRLRGHTPRSRHPWPALAACAAGLWLLAAGAHAGSVYKCVDGRGTVAFQDTPCAMHARQEQVAAAGQPLIDAAAPPPATASAATGSTTRRAVARPARAQAAPRAKGPAKRSDAAVSWECRAANGEVFYRHTACPSTVAGDGVVRERYVEHRNGTRARTDRGAWGRVPVHGAKVTRAAACQRMHSAAAAGRDGHQRDAKVPTYDRLMGRDPCAGD